jgi:hypothetical protein
MSYWLVRGDAPSISAIDGPPGFEIKSRRQPSMQVGDSLVGLAGKGAAATFQNSGKVSSVNRSNEKDRDGYFRTVILVDEWSPLNDPIDLKSVMYSLTLVRNLAKPNLHFRQGYRRLPLDDYETIISGEVFVSRSCFFELLEALPQPTKTAFQFEEILRADSLHPDTGFAERLKRLETFITSRVLSIGNDIMKLDETIEQCNFKSEDGLQIEHVICEEPDDANSLAATNDNIAKQAELFRLLREAVNQARGTQTGENLAPPVSALGIAEVALPSEARFERMRARFR